MLNAFYALKGKYADKKKLADEAIYLERVLCQEAGGWQDQIAASFGGFNRIDFNNNSYEVHPINIAPERKRLLEDNLLLFFTGFTRISAEIQESTKETINEKKIKLDEMLKLVDEAQDILENPERDLNEFGILLDKTWKLKRQTGSRISTGTIDEYYEKGINAGALGGKLLGAGGGGFLLFYVEKEKQDKVKYALQDLMEVPFKFEDSGTTVIYYAPEVFEKRKK
jgi:D-glycero-alpha-D-manno-heptose-7-phosphate kinase